MAAYDPTSGDLHPELTKYNPPEALQDWTAETAGAIQDHVTTQAIADQSQEARSQFINGVASSKDDLVGMVREDPTSAPLAFKLIDNFPLDGVQDHFRNQVAVAAVQGYAAHDKDAAHAAVDKYSDYLGDGEAEALKQHADQLDFIRQTDAAGQAVHQRQMMQRLSDASAGGYLSLLADPSNGSPVFPRNWGTQMMQDGHLEPAAKASLFTAYRNLQANGDPENSDPMAVADLIKRAALGYQNPDHPTQPEVLSQVGGNISLADAGFISGRLGPQPQSARAQTQQLSDALDTARDQIGDPQAYSRFVNWFMPQARNGGNFDPGSKDYLLTPERMDRFMPTGDDIIAPVLARNPFSAQPRPTLSDIFGGKPGRVPTDDDIEHEQNIERLQNAIGSQANVDPVINNQPPPMGPIRRAQPGYQADHMPQPGTRPVGETGDPVISTQPRFLPNMRMKGKEDYDGPRFGNGNTVDM